MRETAQNKLLKPQLPIRAQLRRRLLRRPHNRRPQVHPHPRDTVPQPLAQAILLHPPRRPSLGPAPPPLSGGAPDTWAWSDGDTSGSGVYFCTSFSTADIPFTITLTVTNSAGSATASYSSRALRSVPHAGLIEDDCEPCPSWHFSGYS